jgi:hypothetical protein
MPIPPDNITSLSLMTDGSTALDELGDLMAVARWLTQHDVRMVAAFRHARAHDDEARAVGSTVLS